MKIYKIDGKKVTDVEKLLDEVGNQMAPGQKVEHDVEKFNDSFNDILKEGKTSTKEGEAVDIVWENAADSQDSLGEDKFKKIIDVIRDHGPEGKQSKDNVHLYLA